MTVSPAGRYWLIAGAQGRGLMTRAVNCMTALAWELGFEHVRTAVAPPLLHSRSPAPAC